MGCDLILGARLDAERSTKRDLCGLPLHASHLSDQLEPHVHHPKLLPPCYEPL